MTNADTIKLLKCVDDIYQTPENHMHWQAVLDTLSSYVINGKATISTRNNEFGHIELISPIFTKTFGFTKNEIEEYINFFSNGLCSTTEWSEIEWHHELAELCIYEDHLPLNNLKKTVYYKKYLKSINISGAASIQIFRNEEYRIVLTILHGEPPNSKSLKKLHRDLILLTPHMINAVSLWMSLSKENFDNNSNEGRFNYLVERYNLTKRELEVTAALVRLSSLHKIADSLNISENTVKTHVKSIKKKMGVKSNHEMILRLFSIIDSAE